ncbi:class A sortase [Enterococcus sp. HY326]|uniref:class A sortase n=1 Tax=Enterococcus sp. HY326 TaxID=2971265 RepID=UPI00223FE50C|nr:class A sortase [Enterococcus sp. HY326]
MSKKRKASAKRPQSSRKKKKRNPVFRWLSNIFLLLLLVAGLALVFNEQIKDFLMARNTEQYSIGNYTRDDIVENQDAQATFDYDQVSAISTEAVIQDQFSDSDFAVIGAVAVPSVGINLPIFKGVEYNALFYGAGTTKENQVMGEGNYGLASHRAANADLLFRPLTRVSEGEIIYLTDLENIYTYTIYNIEIVQPTDSYVLDDVPDRTIVTLLTCGDGAGTNRLIVQGELASVTPIADATSDMTAAFDISANTY